MEKLAFTQMQDSTKGEYAALLTRPFVREQCAWSVQTHGDFQMICCGHHVGGNRNKRDQFKDSPFSTIALCFASAVIRRVLIPSMTICRCRSLR